MAETSFLDEIGQISEGCSTLDIMKRLEPPDFPPETLNEMKHLANLGKQHKLNQRARRNEAVAGDITKLGDIEEARNKLRPRFIPDKPHGRVLKGCKLIDQTQAEKKIITSLVRPLSRSTSLQSCRSVDCSASARSTRNESNAQRMTPPKLKELSPAEQEIANLKESRLDLENNLLHVTKKLYRKYEKKVFPGVHNKRATFQTLQKKWSEPILTDSDKYQVYMEGRYATRNDLEFYKKQTEPRDESNHFHRIHRQHTKYGDSLAIAKHSLRDKF